MVSQYRYSRSPDHPYATEMLPLAADERDALRQEAQTAFHQLFPAVQAAVQAGGDGESINVTHRNNSNKSVCMWTSSVLFGTLEEVAMLYLDQVGQVPLVVDAARSRRLYELDAPTKDRALHCTALRWSLWKPPSALSVGRDLCCLEYMDSFVDTESGRRAWARATKSVNHLCCPASQHPEGPVRTKLRVSGMILRETERPGVLEHVTFVHVDARGVPAWVVQQAVAATKRTASGLNQALKIMRQLQPQQAAGGSASVDSMLEDRQRDCRSCREHISKWTRAKRCRFCDAVLCKRCVEVSYHRADASGKNYRMCLPCAMYTGAVVTNRSQSGPIRSHLGRSNSRCARERGATVASAAVRQERRLSASTLSALGKQTSLPGLSLHPSACSEGQRPSMSTHSAGTESAGSSSREDAAAVAVADRLEHMQLQQPHSPTSSLQSSRSASSAQSSGGEWQPRSRSRRESLVVALELEPPRPEPIDLSYLSELVTPRANATRDVDI